MKRVTIPSAFLLIISLLIVSPLKAQVCGDTRLLGENDRLSSTGDLPGNVWKALQFRAGTSGRVSCFKVFLKDLPHPAHHSHNLGYALYTNDPSAHGGCGQPGELIAHGSRSQYDWSVVGAGQWHGFPLSRTAEVTRGTLYWLAFCSDGGHDGWHFGRASASNDRGHTTYKRGCNTHRWNTIPEGDEWNIVYPDQNSPCSEEGTYSWYVSTGSPSNTTTVPAVTTSVNSTTTTSTGGTTTTSGPTTTTSSPFARPRVHFLADPKFGFAPLSVSFTNLSTGPIAGYLWDFGDGTASTETEPVHTYTDHGIFNVKLVACGEDGNSMTASRPHLIVTLLGCPLTAALDNHETITTLRLLRNHMLKNFFGVILVSLYYRNSNAIMKRLIDNPVISDRIDSFVSENIHVAEAILTQNRSQLPERTLQEAIELLGELKLNSTKPLAEDLTVAIAIVSNRHILFHLGLFVE